MSRNWIVNLALIGLGILAIVLPLITPKSPADLQIEDLGCDFQPLGPKEKNDWSLAIYYRLKNVGDRPASEARIIWRHGIDGKWLSDIGGWVDLKTGNPKWKRWIDPHDTFEGAIESRTAAAPRNHILRGNKHLPIAILLIWNDPGSGKTEKKLIFYDLFRASSAWSGSAPPVIGHNITNDLPSGFHEKPSFNPRPTALLKIEPEHLPKTGWTPPDCR